MSPEVLQRYEVRITRAKTGRKLEAIHAELRALFPNDDAVRGLGRVIAARAAELVAPHDRAARADGRVERTRASSRRSH